MAAALSLVMIVSMIVLSRFKYDIMEMTLSFLDVLVVDADTVAFLLTIFPDLRPALAVLNHLADVAAIELKIRGLEMADILDAAMKKKFEPDDYGFTQIDLLFR